MALQQQRVGLAVPSSRNVAAGRDGFEVHARAPLGSQCPAAPVERQQRVGHAAPSLHNAAAGRSVHAHPPLSSTTEGGQTAYEAGHTGYEAALGRPVMTPAPGCRRPERLKVMAHTLIATFSTRAPRLPGGVTNADVAMQAWEHTERLELAAGRQARAGEGGAHGVKTGDISREAEAQGAWAQGCRQNGLLRDHNALAFKGTRGKAQERGTCGRGHVRAPIPATAPTFGKHPSEPG